MADGEIRLNTEPPDAVSMLADLGRLLRQAQDAERQRAREQADTMRAIIAALDAVASVVTPDARCLCWFCLGPKLVGSPCPRGCGSC